MPRVREPGLSEELKESSEKFAKVIERSVRGFGPMSNKRTDERSCGPT